MKSLTEEIESVEVPRGSAALWWLAGAGFVLKTSGGQRLYLDSYLSDAVERAFGFKRLSLAPIEARDVRADWIVNSHEHLDHLDVDSLEVIARRNPLCRFAGPRPCVPEYGRCGITGERQLLLAPGGTYDLGDVTLRTVRADHGSLSLDALSLLFDFRPVRVLFTGDTALQPERLRPLLDARPDVLIPCINGAFGNMDAREAAELTRIAAPRVVVPCHFWLFKEHGGDPEAFFRASGEACPEAAVRFLTPGEGLLVTPGDVRPAKGIPEEKAPYPQADGR